MQCQNEFPKRSKEQTKASKVQVKSELRDFSRPWWHEGGVQGGDLRFESFARNISDDDDGNDDDDDGDEDEDNLSREEGVHEEEQLLQLGTDHLLGHLRTMFSVHFV